jgi:hypothetical protein
VPVGGTHTVTIFLPEQEHVLFLGGAVKPKPPVGVGAGAPGATEVSAVVWLGAALGAAGAASVDGAASA